MNKYTRKLALASAVSMALGISAVSVAAYGLSGEVTEARQESQILTTYMLSRHLDAGDVDVSVDGGVATLTGKVNEDVSRELAQQIALSVDGVEEVDNQIVVDADHEPSNSSDERSYRELVEDSSITAMVKSKLLWSKHAQGMSADVDTASGKVTLTGSADNSATKEMAGLLAGNTHGVTEVDNQLVVEEENAELAEAGEDETSGLGQDISDTWITTKVKSTLMYSSNIDGSDISVTTRDGVVTLNGKVASDIEHALAVELVKNVRGVSSVNARALTHS